MLRMVNVKCEYERGGGCAGDGQPGSMTGGRSTTFVVSTGCLMSVLTDSNDTIFLSKSILSIIIHVFYHSFKVTLFSLLIPFLMLIQVL